MAAVILAPVAAQHQARSMFYLTTECWAVGVFVVCVRYGGEGLSGRAPRHGVATFPSDLWLIRVRQVRSGMTLRVVGLSTGRCEPPFGPLPQLTPPVGSTWSLGVAAPASESVGFGLL